ncbi:DUF421 domain-containing protein [Qipengyuania sp. YG27]|uniref:DUF421 domain-containing protein n=1 Tax=Qipengyuania mesophila TaxID=2867246 RepID=A0ABS7JS00_9SPHN|nr:YetF domain-containing protein [Qipengyuania mesophila]MBX7500419.1 DUF421 domain-containing protein [Qipengyuania mesophila]
MSDTSDWLISWGEILDTALSALLFYVLIVAMVRLVGKRATAQLNNFDWIVNITVGSLAASGILLKTVPALRAVVAIAVIALLQVLITVLARRVSWVSQLVKAEPTLLVDRGTYLQSALRKTRIAEEEVCAALRAHGLAQVDDANWVILETDGQMSVIPKTSTEIDEASTMGDVDRNCGAQEAENG